MTARAWLVPLAAVAASAAAPLARGEDASAVPAAVELAPAAQATPARPRTAVLGELTLSGGFAERGVALVGGRLSLRLGPAALSAGVDGRFETSGAQPRVSALVLAGPGVVHDLSPRLGAHASLLLGVEALRIRDYVDGGWRGISEVAAGVRAGIEWRLPGSVGPKFHSGWLGQMGLAPVLGASASVVYVGRGSDRLRGIEWGGVTALVALSVGGELASPPRDARAEPAPAAGAEAPTAP